MRRADIEQRVGFAPLIRQAFFHGKRIVQRGQRLPRIAEIQQQLPQIRERVRDAFLISGRRVNAPRVFELRLGVFQTAKLAIDDAEIRQHLREAILIVNLCQQRQRLPQHDNRFG